MPSTTGGCDTAATLNLTVNNLLTKIDDITICTAQLPYTWYGQQYNAAGTYNTTVPSTTGGCDTAATLNLTVSSGLVIDTSATACKTFTWDRNGQTYNVTGTYDVTIPNGVCTDTVRLHLTINTPAETDKLTTACKTSTWHLDRQTYNANGTNYSPFTNVS